MGEITYSILRLFMVVIFTIIIKYLIPFLKQKIDTQTIENVAMWVKTSTLAAEQTVTESGKGAEKKAIVTQFIKEILIKKKIALSDEQISELIEATVKTMNIEEREDKS